MATITYSITSGHQLGRRIISYTSWISGNFYRCLYAVAACALQFVLCVLLLIHLFPHIYACALSSQCFVPDLCVKHFGVVL